MNMTHDATFCVTLLRRGALWSAVCLLASCSHLANTPFEAQPDASAVEPADSNAAPKQSKSVPVRLLAAPPPEAPLRPHDGTPATNKEIGSSLLEANEPADEIEIKIRNMLLGQKETQVRDVFGEPQTETLRAPGKVWCYETSRRAMNIFLYLDIRTNEFRVLTLDVMPPTHSETCNGKLAESDS